jgi:hypothetical protein
MQRRNGMRLVTLRDLVRSPANNWDQTASARDDSRKNPVSRRREATFSARVAGVFHPDILAMRIGPRPVLL